MIGAQRRNVIIETIERDGAVSISALSERLETSAVTIRRDLDQLADEGRLTRTHGGAVPFPARASRAMQRSSSRPWPRSRRSLVRGQACAHRRCGRSGARHHDRTPGQGTQRTLGHPHRDQLPPRRRGYGLLPDIEVIVVGGILRHSIRAFVGGGTVSQLLGLRADTVFLSGNGLAADFGLSTPAFPWPTPTAPWPQAPGRSPPSSTTRRSGRSSVLTVPTEEIHHLITDSDSDPAELDALREAGVNVEVA